MPQKDGRLSEGTRALVWGARGFIGSHLVPELLTRGYEVVVLARVRPSSPPPAWAGQVCWHRYDPADPNRIGFAPALDGVSVVFNLAGSSGAVASNRDPVDSLETNCRLQLEFLEACRMAGRLPHVVFASSRLVYARAATLPVSEAHPLAPRSMYAAHKLCVEHYHRIYRQLDAVTFTIARISNPFGIEKLDDKGYGFINLLIARARAGQPLTLFGDGRQLRDYVYVRDLVDALVRCAEQPGARDQVLNIGRGEGISMADAALLVRRAVGGAVPIEFVPWPPDHETVESGDYVADISKAAALIGYRPAYDFAAGLAEILDGTAAEVSVMRASPTATGLSPAW